MWLFSRIWGLIKGFFSLFVKDVEKNNPEIAYENAINTLTSKYVAFKKAAASIIRRRDNIKKRLRAEQDQLQGVNTDLNQAVQKDQDDVAIVLIQRQQVLEGEVTDLEEELTDAQKDAADSKESLEFIKTKIYQLKDERDRMIAKMQSAEAKIHINEQLEGISIDGENMALSDARENIKNRLTEAKLSEELQENDLDSRLKLLRERGNRESAVEKLKKMKAAATVSEKEM